MKHIRYYLSVVLTTAALLAIGQSQRLVLLEHFTNASCGPCAYYNPSIETLLSNNTTKMTAIMYHTNWPGTDPMNAHNPSDASNRVGLYGVTGVPTSVLDGNYYNGSPANLTQTLVNNRYQVPAPFDIQIQHYLNAGQDTLFVIMLVKATQNVSGNLVAHLVVIEKEINFASPPGTNGEKDFSNVMKKMLPSNAGTPISGSFLAGDYTYIKTFWKLANVYDKTRLGVVGFVQNKTNSEILQAANSTTSPVVPPYATDISLMQMLKVGANHCSESIDPGVVVRNHGSQAVTGITLKYRVNMGAEQTYQWTGNLGFLQTALVQLPASTFSPFSPLNTVEIYAASVNGGPDNFLRNDTLRKDFGPAPNTSPKVYLFLRTDNKPEQTAWKVTDEAGTVKYSGGPYTQANKIYTQTFNFTDPGCYRFELYDAGGDGICCSSGYGVYQLTSDVPNQIVGEGAEFGYDVMHSFESGNVGIEEPAYLSELSLYPNPAADVAILSFNLDRQAWVKVELKDMLGKLIFSQPVNNLLPGSHEITIPAAKLDDGMYLVNIDINGSLVTRKLQVVR